jgi:hypothetical protein
MKKYYFNHVAHLTDDEVGNLFDSMSDQKMFDIVFYVQKMDKYAFILFARNPANWMIEIKNSSGKTCGFFWLNGFYGKAAMIHFCIWKTVEDKIEVGKEALAWLKKTGSFDSLYGLTPKPYRHVKDFAVAIGFKITGELNGACYLKSRDRHVPGFISIINLGDK